MNLTKPRLLSLNTYNYRRGGSDAMFLEHDALFAKTGWDTARFTMQHPHNEPSPWNRYFVDELEFGADYTMWRKARMAGKVIYSLEARRKLRHLLNAWRPDIAHAHCIYHHISPSVLGVLRRRGIPVVLTAHDLKLACPAYKMLNKNGICEQCKGGNLLHVVKNRCIHDSLAVSTLVMVESAVHKGLGLYRRNLDRIVVPSRFYERKLQDWGWPASRIVYIPNFIHADFHYPDFDPGEYLCYFGRLAPEKGVATLIRAAGSSRIPLHIAGTGPSEGELKALARDIGAKVVFHGYCSGETLYKLVRGARAIVLPAEWYENAPVSVLEAYANGKIVIGARIGGIPELIQEQQTGFLFDSGDARQLTETIAKVQSMPDGDIAAMGRAARLYVERAFSPQRYLADMKRLYRSFGITDTNVKIQSLSGGQY